MKIEELNIPINHKHTKGISYKYWLEYNTYGCMEYNEYGYVLSK